MARRRKLKAEGSRGFGEKIVGRLNQNPRPVARVGLASARAAMVQIAEDGEGLGDDFVRFPAFDVDDKADAARFVLELRVVKALFRRRPVGPRPARSR